MSRSRKGAWIEIADVRKISALTGRSRKGAWIEMFGCAGLLLAVFRRSRKGAWIEIVANKLAAASYNVAPVRERGLKCSDVLDFYWPSFVAPVRERGLKSEFVGSSLKPGMSLP